MRRLVFVLVAIATTLMGPYSIAAEKPNVVIILCDDMGFSDIGCYGGEIATPNIDALAKRGLRFSHFYNTARCCPTRASLLTGLYPHQTGIGHMTDSWSEARGPGYQGDLNNQCVTIAQALKPAGYATAAVGKWHVSRSTTPDGDKHNWPLQRGFDRYYGTIKGAGSYFDPGTLVRDNTMISPVTDREYQPTSGYYYTDAIGDHAVRYIRETPAEKPLLLYVAFTAAHWPMHARPEDIAKYHGKYDGGYGPARAARFERARQLGLIQSNWQLSPQDENWDEVADNKWEAACMETYAAMVECMDRNVGHIVEALRGSNRLDNTLILWLQDNGGCAETIGRQKKPLEARPAQPTHAAMAPGDLQMEVIPKWTRDGFPVRQGVGVMPGPADTYIGYGRGWANVSNTPFREYKHWVHEGGISTPLVAHWPAGIKRAGEIEHTPGHLIDIMATCVDISGAKYPSAVDGQAIKPMEGRSLKPLFTSGGRIEREAIYWEHEGNRAVRAGDWKLVAKGRKGKWELYNMANDRTELHDLAEQEPSRVAELAAMWNRYAERTNVLPWPAENEKKGKHKK